MNHPAARRLRLPVMLLALSLTLHPASTHAQQEPRQAAAFRQRIQRLQRGLDQLEASGSTAKANELRQRLNDSINEAEDRLFADSREAAQTESEYDYLVATCNARLARLKKLRPKDDTDPFIGIFTERLADLEASWKDGTTFIPAGDQPIVQWIHAQDPAWAPGTDQSNPTGQIANSATLTATIHLDKLSRPTILALTSDVTTDWKLTGETSNVQAVVLHGFISKFECDEEKLVLRRSSRRKLTEEDIPAYARGIEAEIGYGPDLMLTVRSYDQPIQLDPRRKDWTRAYVIGRLARLSRNIQAEANDAFAASHSDLRFPGFTVETESFMRYSSLAEFNLKGPANNDRRPMTMQSRRQAMGINMWNYTDVGDNAYALIQHGQFAKRGASDGDWQNVKSPPESNAFRSIARDTKRNRLVMLDSEGALYAYDLAKEEEPWTLLRNNAKELFGLAYQPDSDLIVAIQQTPSTHPRREKETRLVYLDDKGRISREIKSSYGDSIQNPIERTYNEFALTDKYLIATQPPATSRRHPLRNIIRVFDLETAEVHYDFMLPANNLTESNTAPGNANTFAAYKRKLRAAQVAVERARAVDREAAAKLAEQLQELADPISHARRPRKEPVIYWARTFRNKAPLIKITDKSGPIILAVSSFVLREWRFEIEDGVDIREVIFVGLNPPEYKGLRENIKITTSTENLKGNERQPSYQKSIIEKLVTQSAPHTKPKFAAELDLSSRDNVPFVIAGPANARETIGQANAALNELTLAAGKISGDSRLSEDFRFAYIYQGDGEDQNTTFLAECDFRGPILQTQRRLPTMIRHDNLNRIAYAGPRHFYGQLSEEGISELRVHDTNVTVAPVSIDNSNLRHLMYDSGTQRLLGGYGDSLNIQNERKRSTWTNHSVAPLPTRNSHRTAWCYDAAEQRFFAIVRTHFDLTEVHEVSSAGKLVRKLKLPAPISAELHPDRKLFSAYCDSKNIIIVMRAWRGNGTVVRVLDIETLDTVHKGEFRPHIVYENVSPDRLSLLWERLASADEFEADAIKWQLVAGGREVAERLKQIAGTPDGLSKVDVALLVKQLDANTYAERQAASEKLLMSGQKHADYLRGLERADLSLEQWVRIQKLLGKWDGGDDRARRAMEIIKEIEAR